MGALNSVIMLAAALAAVPLEARPTPAWRSYIVEASQRFAVPTRWIERVIARESGGRIMVNGRPIRSRAGAIGLMQLMPATWAAMRDAYALGDDPDDPHDNILAGTAYLRRMYDRFGYPGLFAAYNAGPKRYAAYLGGRRALPAETRAYLTALVRGGQNAVSIVSPRPSLFAIGGGETAPDDVPNSDDSDKRLFALSTAR